MANISVAFFVVAFFGGSTSFRTGAREQHLKERLKACREQHGSHWYYVEYLNRCCPCTPCNYTFPVRSVECYNKAEGQCKARYDQQCRYLSVSRKIVAEIMPASVSRKIMAETVPAKNVTTSSSTTVSSSTLKSSLQKDELSMDIVIIVSVAVFCTAALLACACCLASRNEVCGLLKKVGLSELQSSSNISKSKRYASENGSSVETKTLIKEGVESENRIQPSFSDSNCTASLESSHGPPGMVNAPLVRHVSQESDYSTENSRGDQPDSVRQSQATRNVVRSEMPMPNDFIIRECQRIGVVAAPYSQVTIHNLNVGSNPEHVSPGANFGYPLNRVEPQPVAPATKTFDTSNRINNRRRDRSLHRQSSEMSSASSGPVENETHPAAVWQNSDARQDQISALETCSQSQDSCGRSGEPALQNGGAAYRRLNSDMSSCSSRSTQSSGLPPECDMEPFGKQGRV